MISLAFLAPAAVPTRSSLLSSLQPQKNPVRLPIPHRPVRRRRVPSLQPPTGNLADAQQSPTPPQSSVPSARRILTSLWKFSRPHTVYGTLISILTITSLAARLHSVPLTSYLSLLFVALIPALLLNVYIVGINQLYDISIDRVNKPRLPLASGAMTVSDANLTILLSLLFGLSFCLHPLATPALRTVLIGSALLGTAYSVPPFRLKRFALLASIAILTVRGLLVNLGFYLHVISPTFPRPLPLILQFATVFFTVFGVVIALLKDVPDIKGDRLFGIRTFSVRVGAPAIFKLCVYILCSMFSGAAVFYFTHGRTLLGRIASACLHALMAFVLASRARKVDPLDSKQVTDYYMFSWKAFYAEYLLLPLAAL